MSSKPPAPGPGRPELIDGPVLAKSEPVGLEIPALGLRTSELVPLGLQPDGSMEVPADAEPVGWYTGAPPPGSLGPAILAAHVDWKGALGPFHDLRDLQPGDAVFVARADGSTAEFRVSGVDRYPKGAFPTEQVYGTIDHAGLRLITCGGEFDEGADSYRDNVVAYAELVGSSAS
ncbi:class F sortase [Pseudonocardia nigra]|uniref:class F sortase n=1 Tax=Pseudonocardia nigra TaxID=1921578 RepID=UPI001C602364|nr:class F sortase [Pseudonocardia nigra]